MAARGPWARRWAWATLGGGGGLDARAAPVAVPAGRGQPRPRLRLLALRGVLVALAWSVGVAAAAGTERYGDVTVTVGDATGPATPEGYVGVPVTITNDGGRARRVSVRLPERSYGGGNDHLASLRRSFDVEPGGTARAELLLPPLDLDGNGAAAVSIDGVGQEDGVYVNVGGAAATPGLLVSGSIERAVRSRLEAAVEAYNSASGGGFGGFGRVGAVSATVGGPVERWSRSWLGYSGFAGVLVAEADLRRMPAAVAAALRDWVFAGGQLVVLDGGGGGSRVDPLAGGAQGLGRVTRWGPDAPERNDDAAAGCFLAEALRFADADARPMNAEAAERSFPVVEDLSTPVRGLVLLMLLFAVLIGPVNVLVLGRLKRRMWLLWTVPLGSAVFSVGVVLFALLSEGVSPKARTQAVTYLDQTTRQAVTVGMRGYYAPLTPGGGLRFPLSTRVVPQVDRAGWRDGGRGRSVDLTRGQHLTRGWVVARVPAHLELTGVTQTRLRLDVEELPGGGVAVTNGLGVDLRALALSTPDGRGFRTGPLAAGERAELEPTDAVRASPVGSFAELVRGRGWGALATPGADPTNVEPGGYEATTAASAFLADGIEGLTEHRVEASILGRYAPPGSGTSPGRGTSPGSNAPAAGGATPGGAP